MMEILTGKRDRSRGQRNIEYPLPWVPADDVKLCEGDKFENGCNAFPTGKVPASFVTEVFNPSCCRNCPWSRPSTASRPRARPSSRFPQDAVVAGPERAGHQLPAIARPRKTCMS